MNNITFVSITCYSQLDKDLFFEWIEALPCVESYKTENDQLIITLKQEVTDEDLLDLVAICVRYTLDIHELSNYMHENNKYWWTGPKFQVIYPQLNKDKKTQHDNNKNLLRLDCTPVDLYTQLDKNNMFEWMERISSVKDIVGLGPVIYLYLSVNEITQQDIRELEGLFSRYNFDAVQVNGLLGKSF